MERLDFNPKLLNITWTLTALLSASLFVRLLLILTSGELIHTDGPEYFGYSTQMYQHMIAFDLKGVFTTPVNAHWGCILFGTIPFFIKISWLTQAQVSAIFFALPSVVNIFLVYKIALAFNLPIKTALIATFLYALSFTGIYQVRHVLPHDLALLFFLSGILLTLATQDKKSSSFFLAGFCYFLCFFTYYGYWSITLIGMLFTALYKTNSIKLFIHKGCLSSIGLLLPLILFLLIGRYYNTDYLTHFIGFSKTINMGVYNEGHSLPLFFLYHAEGPLFFIWIICLLIAALRIKQSPIKYFVSGVLLLYIIFVIGSNVLQYFVVYGRLVKAMVPMLCLLAACILSPLSTRVLIFIFILVLQNFLINSWTLHKAIFPADVFVVYDKEFKKKRSDGHKLVLALNCVPYVAICDSPKFENCKVLQSFLMSENSPFFQYDGTDPEPRRLLQNHKGYLEMKECPIAQQ